MNSVKSSHHFLMNFIRDKLNFLISSTALNNAIYFMQHGCEKRSREKRDARMGVVGKKSNLSKSMLYASTNASRTSNFKLIDEICYQWEVNRMLKMHYWIILIAMGNFTLCTTLFPLYICLKSLKAIGTTTAITLLDFIFPLIHHI